MFLMLALGIINEALGLCTASAAGPQSSFVTQPVNFGSQNRVVDSRMWEVLH